MQIRSALLIGTFVAASACRTHPVSVVTPELQRDVTDLSAISESGDTTWRASAASDVASHVHMIQASTPTPHATIARPKATGFGAISPETVNQEPTDEDLIADDGPGILRAQVLLDRAHFSSGVLNGRAGQNMAKAVYFFQEEHGITPTGKLDRATYDELVERVGRTEAAVQYTLTDADIRGPYFWIPASVYEQADLPCECYASAMEMLDERFHTITEVMRRLNPSVSFGALKAGQQIWVPNVDPFSADHLGRSDAEKPIVKIHVAKEGRYLHALAADGSIVYHFPTTVGSEYDPSPSGNYHVAGVQWHPVFHYDPSLYSDVPDSRPRTTLKPGPNSPVGVVWIATSKEHVGIHGTPLPHTIGLASSHGCVRLTNWDAARLAAAVKEGVTVEFRK